MLYNYIFTALIIFLIVYRFYFRRKSGDVVKISESFSADQREEEGISFSSPGVLALNPSSPFYNWHLSGDLESDVLVPWDEVFNSRLISNDHPNFSDVITALVEEYELSTEELKKELIIVYWSSSPETWKKLCGRSGYLFVWKTQKKQFKLSILTMS